MACLNCQMHFSQHSEEELFECINFYSTKFTELADNYRKLFDKFEESKVRRGPNI